MAVGLLVGVVGGAVLLWLMRHSPLPDRGLYPIRVLAIAGAIYGLTAVLHGSGFLAVFIAGLLIGDERAPYKAEIESFHTSLASLAEIAVFVVLGLTIDVTLLADEGWWLEGLVVFAVLAFVVRPLVALPLLLPARLRRGERIFIAWGGLKGAVPIILAAFAVLAAGRGRRPDLRDRVRRRAPVRARPGLDARARGRAARRADADRRAESTSSTRRGRTASASPPARTRVGRRIRDLPLGESGWVGVIVRDGSPQTPHGSDVLEPGDEVRRARRPRARARRCDGCSNAASGTMSPMRVGRLGFLRVLALAALAGAGGGTGRDATAGPSSSASASARGGRSPETAGCSRRSRRAAAGRTSRSGSPARPGCGWRPSARTRSARDVRQERRSGGRSGSSGPGAARARVAARPPRCRRARTCCG